MDSKDNMEENKEKAFRFMNEALKENVDIICLSEKFLYWGKGRGAIPINSPILTEFQDYAKAHNVNLILGSLAIQVMGTDTITNTSLVINRLGEIIHRYDKIYMYTVDREDLKVDEGDDTVKGSQLGLFLLEGIKMGIGICFDLRYPEYFKALSLGGAEVIFLPANFRKSTGFVAWDILTRARAIENQAYFCACGQTGGTKEKERCGKSQIISYDGNILSSLNEEEGVVIATLDIDKLRQFRKEFPVLKQVEKF